MESECKGCASNKSSYCRAVVIPQISSLQECPCKTCLIKMVCHDQCTKLTNYRISIFEQIRKEEKERNGRM